MAHELIYGTVLDRPRKVIHVLRILGEILDVGEIDEIADRMRERMLRKRGEQAADVVVVQGTTRETMRLFGDAYAVGKVRAALFNAAMNWSPLTLD
jgi:hypothetical protein